MATMNISLTPELAKAVKARVESGQYNNASEVVRDAIRRMNESDALYQYKLNELREALKPGLEDAKNGNFVDYSLEELIKDMDNEV